MSLTIYLIPIIIFGSIFIFRLTNDLVQAKLNKKNF